MYDGLLVSMTVYEIDMIRGGKVDIGTFRLSSFIVDFVIAIVLLLFSLRRFSVLNTVGFCAFFKEKKGVTSVAVLVVVIAARSHVFTNPFGIVPTIYVYKCF